MIKAINDSGFTPVPDDIRLTVTGNLEAREGHFFLVLDQMIKPRALSCVTTRPGDALNQALKENAGRTVEIHGRWRFDGEGSLQVETVEGYRGAP